MPRELRGDVVQEREKRAAIRAQESLEAQKREAAHGGREYAQAILAVEQLLAEHRSRSGRSAPGRGLAGRVPAPSARLGVGISEKTAERRNPDDLRAFGIPLRHRLSTGHMRPSLSVGSSRRLDLGYRQRIAEFAAFTDPTARPSAPAIDRSGTRLATAGSDGQVKVWNVVLGRLDHAFRAHEGWAADVAFSPDGTRLASAGQDDKVRIWNLALEPTPGSANPVPSLVISARHAAESSASRGAADGKRLAAAGKDGTVRIWDLSHSPPRSPLILRGHEGEVLCVSFHPGGRLIASGGADRYVRIWDAATGLERTSFRAAASRVNAIAFSPDGKLLATGSLDGPVGLWDAATGKPVGILRGHAEPVFEVAFNSDGTKLISAGQHATLKLWDLTAEPGLRLFRAAKPAGHRAIRARRQGRPSAGSAASPFAPTEASSRPRAQTRRSRSGIFGSGRLERTLQAPMGSRVCTDL